jgi:hypothetical protein
MRVKFRGSTGQVHSADVVLLAPGQDAVHGFLSHQLRAFGTCIDMTMGAGLIAQIPEIQLQVHGIASAKGRQPMLPKRAVKRCALLLVIDRWVMLFEEREVA